ncbi:Enoyl-CoA hydratase AKT3-1 [Penicillium canescens]|uniref:Enoyl-CoA hydratase AKT3-1 n=1 Tax=Penicillium canescens TaxID=5083 RepID=A0AAD6IBR9_PENCN|nr:Enoyl-CoA hydratase AKT3-1 [Penicillium canescens]KAJ6043054.1 Enoyl-CoA hydratase AKT3-1 [Penicillium canescens]KAJ6054530.1 Enoyl-CoA hydratase AKT3-1 [Penicillium canescens]KAJ6073473.1 Enoyl-CoA hydratase AKT3-1 [Penicillium canescens]
MAPPAAFIEIPDSYESLDLTHVKVSHYPLGSPTATPVVIVTLNRPEKNNAFTPHMADSLELAFQTFHLDQRVKAIVLTGAGRMFCAGSDLGIGFSNEGRAVDFRDIGGRVALAMHRCHKPTIVALNGSAVGVGMTMTLPAAIRICHETSKYGFVFTRRGLTIESCASYFLPRLIGLSRAMSLISTGGVYPGNSKYFGDLFTETLSNAAQVLPRSLELAQEMAENVSPLALSMSQALMWEGPSSPEAAHLLESRVFHHMAGQSDYTEGVSSFLEKRKANFQCDPHEHSPLSYPWWSEVDINVEPKKSKL